MSPMLTSALLGKPAAQAARVIASEHLKLVTTQLEVFVADETAGFHDLRVSLRRLRSWMRAFRPDLDDTVRGKTRRALRKLAHVTNAPRDAEAMLEWIDAQDDLSSRDRAGVRFLRDHLEREHASADDEARSRLRKKLPKLSAALAKQLESYWIRYDADEPARVPSMARVTYDALVTHAGRFARAVDRIESPDDASQLHRVRIAAKRLRYLLEMIDEPSAIATAERLSILQDGLGVAHDMHGVVNRIVRELGEIGARDARLAALSALNTETMQHEPARLAVVRPGLKTLASRALAAEHAAVEAFRVEWSADQVANTVAAITVLGDDLVERTHRQRAHRSQ